MTSLTAQQRQTAIDAIIHMEGTDGSDSQYGPTVPEWGGSDSDLSHGQLQNDVSQGENKYDTISNSQTLLEMLENFNYDRKLDEKIVAYASTSAGAKAIFQETNPTSRQYYNTIYSALSAPQNLPIWQAQDIADENTVIDKLNEAINYINEKNPDGAGALSWSALDPKALMALAAWTNQHQNIVPMVEALGASASSKKPITVNDLLSSIYQQPYFQGPKAYSLKFWQKRIDDTFRYVNHRENSNFNDSTPSSWLVPSAYGDTLPNGTDSGYLPNAAKTLEPASSKPEASHATAAFDMIGAYENILPYISLMPLGDDALELGAQPVPAAMQLNDQMIAIGEAILKTERETAQSSPGGRASADTYANLKPDWSALALSGALKPNAETIALAAALYKAIHKEPLTPADQDAGTHRRHSPTGHRDDPIFIHPNGNMASKRTMN